MYDLKITGGTIVDGTGKDRFTGDVAVKDGRIVAVGAKLDGDAAESIDASGMLVLPGLVDLHSHTFHGFSFWGVDPDPIATRTGVTTWNDAGTPGALKAPQPCAFWTEPTWPPGQLVFTEKQQRLHDLGHTPDAMAAPYEHAQEAIQA